MTKGSKKFICVVFLANVIFGPWLFSSTKETYENFAEQENLGTHLLVDFWKCKNSIEDVQEVEDILVKAAKEVKSHAKEVTVHKFDPQGVTGVIVLSESHISIHTWPEYDYVALDIFTCGPESRPHAALEYLKQVFDPEKVEVKEVKRGEISKQEDEEKVFGLELTLDLFDCDPEAIRSGEKIKEYSEKLCDLIEMKRFGQPFLQRFAVGSEYAAGYSFAQMIETSLVSGHFCEAWNSAYINIFSCKTFDAQKAEDFTKDFFGAKTVKAQSNIR